MKRIYIIGAISQIEEINRVANKLMTKNKVRIPKLTDSHFKNIQWCDVPLVVAKPDRTFGESITHEVCFEEFLQRYLF